MLYVLIQGAAYLVGGNRKAIQGKIPTMPVMEGAHQ
jgi:hypothetical protein